MQCKQSSERARLTMPQLRGYFHKDWSQSGLPISLHLSHWTFALPVGFSLLCWLDPPLFPCFPQYWHRRLRLSNHSYHESRPATPSSDVHTRPSVQRRLSRLAAIPGTRKRLRIRNRPLGIAVSGRTSTETRNVQHGVAHCLRGPQGARPPPLNVEQAVSPRGPAEALSQWRLYRLEWVHRGWVSEVSRHPTFAGVESRVLDLTAQLWANWLRTGSENSGTIRCATVADHEPCVCVEKCLHF